MDLHGRLPEIFKDLRILVKFCALVDVRRKEECWPWTGSTNGHYGILQLFNPRKNLLAHRLAYSFDTGIIAELNVCHSCDDTLCCNPHHLWVGTQMDNLRDMIRKGRRVQGDVRGAKNGRAILNEEQVIFIRQSSLPVSALAQQYGVMAATISAIKTGRNWKHLWINV